MSLVWKVEFSFHGDLLNETSKICHVHADALKRMTLDALYFDQVGVRNVQKNRVFYNRHGVFFWLCGDTAGSINRP